MGADQGWTISTRDGQRGEANARFIRGSAQSEVDMQLVLRAPSSRVYRHANVVPVDARLP